MARAGTDWAHKHIDAFAARSIGEPIWPHLRRPKVAVGLHSRVDDPDKIHQWNTNLCGITGFVRDWAYDAPDIYAWVATQLYETGRAVLGRGHHANKNIEPSVGLRNAPLPLGASIDPETGTHEMPHADWLILASLREAFNTLLHYSGTQRGVVGSIFDTLLKPFGASTELLEASNTAGDVVACFKAAGYDPNHIVDKTNYLSGAGYNNAMEANEKFLGGWRVVLLINARMLSDATEDTQAMLIASSDHWVGLASSMGENMAHGLSFNVHSWGLIRHVPEKKQFLPLSAFLKNYYGFVAAKF